MDDSGSMSVTGKDGLRGVVEAIPQPDAGSKPQVVVRLEGGQRILVPVELLVLQADGRYYLPLSLADLEAQGALSDTLLETQVLPVIAEELDIQKQWIEQGRIRITKVIHAQEEVVDAPMFQEEVTVERVPINRAVEESVPVRYEGETLVIPVVEEVLFVEKRLLLKEELHLSKRQVTTRQPQQVLLRSEEAIVERIEGPTPQEVDTTEIPGTSPHTTVVSNR